MTPTVIISVYKNVSDLKVVLDSLKKQSIQNFHVIISEDGKSEVMQEFLNEYDTPLSLVHLTQPDEGWRKNKALNQAIRHSSTEYLIFIDGDCVLHPKFVESHLYYSKPKRILAGKRIKLGPKYSKLLRKESSNINEFARRILPEMVAIKKDQAEFYEEGIYINPSSFFGFIPKLRDIKELKGCNFSCYKDAMVAINGFDEQFTQPAVGEDIDITWRLKAMGYSLFSLRNRAVQYHLHHKESWTDQSENEKIMLEKQRNNEIKACRGLIDMNNDST